MNGGLGPWIAHEGIYLGILAGIKTARREAARAKQVIEAKVHLKVGELAGSGGAGGPRHLWDCILWGLSGLG